MICSGLVSVNSSEQLSISGGLSPNQLRALLELLMMIAQWLSENLPKFTEGFVDEVTGK
ncbi:MAG: hypothetical protein WC140_06570 [Bacteroidales bacterium]